MIYNIYITWHRTKLTNTLFFVYLKTTAPSAALSLKTLNHKSITHFPCSVTSNPGKAAGDRGLSNLHTATNLKQMDLTGDLIQL